jgi:excisionase family DNA binding protein
MTATDAPDGNSTQPVSETTTSAMIALSVEEAAAHFGITPQAVRKRIKAGHLAAERDGRVWRVYVEAQPTQPDEVSETATGEKFRETPQPHSAKPVALSQRDQFALMVEPIVAPWVAKVEELSREAERNLQRALAAESERDELRRQVEELRTEPGQKADSERDDAPENAQEGSGAMESETRHPDPNAGSAGAGETRRAPWWKRLIWGG